MESFIKRVFAFAFAATQAVRADHTFSSDWDDFEEE